MSFTRSLAMFRVMLAASLLTATTVWGQAAAPTLRLAGVDGATKVLGLSDLEALPQFDVVDSSAERGTLRFRGPALRTLVSLVGAPEGHALRGPSMTLVVLAEARDGYKVAYALAELDEQFAGRRAILALSQNGQQLLANDGPFRVVMPGEAHHARWIRQVSTLRIVRARAPEDRGSAPAPR